MALVQVEKVSKQYRNATSKEIFTSLKNVSLETDTNEFVCLLGPSGCGKSTLLKLIAGLQKADSGRITVEGNEVRTPDGSVGVVFQDYALFPWRTVRRNISIGLDVKHIPKSEQNDKVDWAIKLVGLEKFANYYPHQLSGGMKQRVAIARALVLDSKIMLMDEPFGALDAFTRMNLQDDLIELWQKQKFAAIFVTHDVDEAVYLADKVIVMTPSPGEIKKVFNIELARPRVRTSVDFNMYRSDILKQYGYVDKNTVEYQI